MAEAVSILSELRKGKYEASVQTTFNVYFPFYEDVLLRHFASAGCRHNILLIDGRQCGAALLSESTRPRLAGKEYNLLPIKLSKPFHPKLVLLIGKTDGLLFVGSHNATLAGFSHNREITNRFEVAGDNDTVARAVIQSAWEFIRSWTTGLPEALQSSLRDIESFAKWLKGPISIDAENLFIGARPEGPSLWERVRRHLPHTVKRATVVGPFFDSELAFLKKLNKALSPDELVVAIDPRTASITSQAPSLLPQAKFVDTDCLREGTGYLHAKAILLETQEGKEYLITGSANPSKPAWLNPPGQRNVEAVILRISSKRNSIARGLGLKDLARQPRLSHDRWSDIRIKKEDGELGSVSCLVPLVAIATDNGFEINASSFDGELAHEATIIAPNNLVLGTCTAGVSPDGTLLFEVPDEGVLASASLLKLSSKKGEQLFAIVHHEKALSESSLTARQKDLKNALASLDSDTPMVEELMRIVEKVIFDDNPEVSTVPAGKDEKEKEGVSEGEIVQSDFRIDLKDVKRHAQYKRASISQGDLALLLDALIYRLGRGLQAEVDSSPRYARSEEDLRGSEEEELLPLEEIDGEALVRTCHRKIKNLFRRMVKQLANAAESQQQPLTAVAQMAAVLGLAQRLRELDWETVSWIPRGQTLVPKETRFNFFLDASRLLYARQSGVLKSALSTLKGEPCAEISIVRGLLLALAWDCDLSIHLDKNADPDVIDDTLRGLARLLLIAEDMPNDKEACERTSAAIARLCSAHHNTRINVRWLDDFMRWAKEIENKNRNLRQAQADRSGPEAGDIVFLVKCADPGLFIVQKAFQNKVWVFDFDSKDETKAYGEEYIAVIK